MSNYYILQLLAGKDFAKKNYFAKQMQNFSYFIGDLNTRSCFIIDPAWNIKDLINIAKNNNIKITGILATHHHQDHVGGNFFNVHIEGIKQMIKLNPCKVHAHKLDVNKIISSTRLNKKYIISHESGDNIKIGDINITILHTPGHTEGSCCYKTNKFLFSGDTLFINGCGRTDLPGSNIDDMYNSLHNKISQLPENLILYPGHAYGGNKERLSNVKKNNPFLKIKKLNMWHKMRNSTLS